MTSGYLASIREKNQELNARMDELEAQGVLERVGEAVPSEAGSDHALGKIDLTGCVPEGCGILRVSMLTIGDFFTPVVDLPIGISGFEPVIRFQSVRALCGFAQAALFTAEPTPESDPAARRVGIFDFLMGLPEGHDFIEILAARARGFYLPVSGIDLYAPGDDGPLRFLPIFAISFAGQAERFDSVPSDDFRTSQRPTPTPVQATTPPVPWNVMGGSPGDRLLFSTPSGCLTSVVSRRPDSGQR